MLQGILGGPMQLLSDLVKQCPSLTRFSPIGEVHTFMRVARPELEIAPPRSWIVLSYPKDALTFERDGGGEGLENFALDWRFQISFERAIDRLTESARDEFVNDIGAMLQDLMEHPDNASLTKLSMVGPPSYDDEYKGMVVLYWRWNAEFGMR